MIPRLCTLLLAMSVAVPLSSNGAQRPSTRTPDFSVIAEFDDDRFTWGSISPDGRFLLSGKDSIMVKVLKTGRIMKLTSGGGDLFVWSSHMNRLAWVRVGDAPNGGTMNAVWSIAVDSATGTSRGPAQRVSSGAAFSPGVSADGTMIAYVAGGRSAAPGTLVTVNANGGPERVLASSLDGLDTPWWSHDGQSIYVAGTLAGGTRAVINKVFLDGRRAQLIRAGDGEWFAGMTPDRTRLITVPTGQPVAPGARAVVMDTTGRELWTVPLPDGATAIYDGPIGDSTLVWMNQSYSTTLVVRALNGGSLRRVPLLGESNGQPLWSPDGRRIAFLVRSGLRYDLAVMNADGSNVQRFPGTDVRNEAYYARWSPDSRSLGYVNRAGSMFRVLDLATRSNRTVFSDTTLWLGNFAWTPSGTSIVVFMNRQRSGGVSAFEELSLNGTHRRVVTNADIPGGPNRRITFLPDASLIVRSAAGVFTIAPSSPTPRRLVSIGEFVPSSAMAISPDQEWLAAQIRRSGISNGQLELTSLKTGERRVSALPFWFMPPGTPQFTPDGRGVLMKGRKVTDSSGTNLYLAPTSGEPARFIANLGLPGEFSLSPDGKTLVHTVHLEGTSTLMAVDIRNPKR